MAVYTISDLEKLTGIKAHTLRMWEKRYDLIEPKRTKTNIRYYLDEDLKILMNVALLKRSGYKISKIAEMNEEEITQIALELSSQKQETISFQNDSLAIAMIEMDARKFHNVINQKIDELGFKSTITDVIMPFLERLNLLWMTGAVSPVQENYIAGLIKQKLFVYIDQFSRKPPLKGKKVMLYLPEDEKQELSLYFLHFMLLNEGYQIINLGTDVSLLDLKKASSIKQPDAILSLLNDGFRQKSVKGYVDDLCLHFRPFQIILSGAQIIQQNIKSCKNLHVVSSLDKILEKLEQLDVQKEQHPSEKHPQKNLDFQL